MTRKKTKGKATEAEFFDDVPADEIPVISTEELAENTEAAIEAENVDNKVSTDSVPWPGKFGTKEQKDAYLADQTADAESRPEFDPSD